MIQKQYRLTEKAVKKVLRFRRPFFSQNFVANVLENNLPYSRFGLLLSGKNTPGSVHRNFFRRTYYTTCSCFIKKPGFDVVFVPKKGKTFDKNDTNSIIQFKKDVSSILVQIFH